MLDTFRRVIVPSEEGSTSHQTGRQRQPKKAGWLDGWLPLITVKWRDSRMCGRRWMGVTVIPSGRPLCCAGGAWSGMQCSGVLFSVYSYVHVWEYWEFLQPPIHGLVGWEPGARRKSASQLLGANYFVKIQTFFMLIGNTCSWYVEAIY